MKNLQPIPSKSFKKSTVISLEKGKIPPQAIELEEAVLGAMMIDKKGVDDVIDILHPEAFYKEAHQLIYEAIYALFQNSEPTDLLTVANQLRKTGQLEQVGGDFYLVGLTQKVSSSAHIEFHARIILQKFIQRELIRISGEIIGDAYEDSTDVFDLLDDSETKMFNITNNYLKKNFEEIGQVLAKTINRIDELRTKTEDISGVPTGFPTLDRITYGWQPTDLIILAARPSVGKTAFALNLARNAALHPTKPIPVGFFSLEMSAPQLVQRILSAESEIKMEKISRGKLEDYEYQQLHAKGLKKLERAPLYIDDTAALNIFEFRAKARRLVNKHKVGIIIIDYLQLMSGSGDRNNNREQEISNISRSLKALAKELNIPIIALAQLSRSVEQRAGDKKPMLSDLRESGAIEQDADIVLFVYREEYYIQAREPKRPAEGEDAKVFDDHAKWAIEMERVFGLSELIVAKQRHGATGKVKMKFDARFTRFSDYVDESYLPQQMG